MTWMGRHSDMKQCRTCGEIKPLSEFYKHKEMADGTLNHCKCCVKTRVSQHREDNIEKVREYDRNRSNREERVKYNCEKAKRLRVEGNENFLEKERERTRNYRKSNPDKYKATGSVNNAIRDGKLIRPNNCSCCGKECKPQGHHWSYEEENWLDVVWLCTQCHSSEHKRLRSLGQDID